MSEADCEQLRLINALRLVHAVLNGEEMHNHVEYL